MLIDIISILALVFCGISFLLITAAIVGVQLSNKTEQKLGKSLFFLYAIIVLPEAVGILLAILCLI